MQRRGKIAEEAGDEREDEREKKTKAGGIVIIIPNVMCWRSFFVLAADNKRSPVGKESAAYGPSIGVG